MQRMQIEMEEVCSGFSAGIPAIPPVVAQVYLAVAPRYFWPIVILQGFLACSACIYL